MARWWVVPEFDDLAQHYDETRGGEQRGDEYAATIDALLPAGAGPILEIGVGTGVVALGLRRRNRVVVGLDPSMPMLARAYRRLGSVLACSDGMAMPVAAASVAHAFSVWVIQAVPSPEALFHEAARVLRPGGRYVVGGTQWPADDDEIGQVMADLMRRIDARRGAPRHRRVTADEVLAWARPAGFAGTVQHEERRWQGSPGEELAAIQHRVWPTLRELDEDAIDEVTRPTIEALRSLDQTPQLRRAIADVIVLDRDR